LKANIGMLTDALSSEFQLQEVCVPQRVL